jgi:hypothetical protein
LHVKRPTVKRRALLLRIVLVLACAGLVASFLAWPIKVIDWTLNATNVCVGFVLGSLVGGAVTVVYVIPKVMENKDVKKITGFFKSEEYREYVGLFHRSVSLLEKAIPILERILENQAKIIENRDNQKNHK